MLIADDHAPTRDDVGRALAADRALEVCAMAEDAAQAVQAAWPGGPTSACSTCGCRAAGSPRPGRSRPGCRQAKIVMFTVSDDDADLFAALRAGADGYLLKSMPLAGLRDALIGVCSGEAAMQPGPGRPGPDRFHGREPQWRPSP